MRSGTQFSCFPPAIIYRVNHLFERGKRFPAKKMNIPFSSIDIPDQIRVSINSLADRGKGHQIMIPQRNKIAVSTLHHAAACRDQAQKQWIRQTPMTFRTIPGFP